MSEERRRTLTQRLDAQEQATARIEGKVDSVDGKVDHLTERVDTIGLNGHGPALKAMLDDWSKVRDTVAATAAILPQLIPIARERDENEKTWRTLRRWFRWDKGTRTVFWTVVNGAIGIALFVIVDHLWHLHLTGSP